MEDEAGIMHRVQAGGGQSDCRVLKRAHHMDDEIHRQHMTEKLVPQPLSPMGPLHKPGEIHDFNDRGNALVIRDEPAEAFEAGIRDGGDAGMRFRRREGIIADRGHAGREGIEEGGFSGVRQANQSAAESHARRRCDQGVGRNAGRCLA